MYGRRYAEDKCMNHDPRGTRAMIASVEWLPSPRPVRLASPRDSARDQLVRYFAWGYLSRREVLSLLQQLECAGGARQRVAA
jgi:hypothetical protein